jgi:hypothetical protein
MASFSRDRLKAFATDARRRQARAQSARAFDNRYPER